MKDYVNLLDEAQKYTVKYPDDAEGKEIRLKVGDAVYVAPDEPHQIKNVGDTLMRMVCMIPILPGGDGKKPAPRPDGKGYVTERPKGC